MASTSLLTGWLPLVCYLVGGAGLAYLLFGSRRYMRVSIPVALAAGVLGAFGLKFLIEDVLNVWGQRLEWQVWPAAGVLCAALAALIVRIIYNRGWFSKLVFPVVAFIAVLLAVTVSINQTYFYWPTVGVLWGDAGVTIETSEPPRADSNQITETTPTVKFSDWTPPADMPEKGKVYKVTIPGTVSGVGSGASYVYLPPAYLAQPRANLPVVVAVHGQPGQPMDWLVGGQVAKTMDEYAANNKGLAPVVVIPDISGGNGEGKPWPLCMDTKVGKGATYLSQDVPNYMRETFRLGLGGSPGQFSMMGLSGGGTCALQMGVTAPEIYSTFLDMAGEKEPTPFPGGKSELMKTYFDGDEAAFARVNPLDILKTKKFPELRARLVVGTLDTEFRPYADPVLAGLKEAGAQADLQLLPGGHTWQVWRVGIAENTEWFMNQAGVK